MGLADRLPPERVYRGRMEEILDALTPKDRKVLEDWLADLSISSGRIKTALNAEGHKISEGTIKAYRRGSH